ncbi:MAG: isoprenylcysteine carboxylmethyltransferase family protein [Ignavibacteriaceae bacterium]|jgi:protein-S-isoprenylcysteine O-methyltransferase Ste14|nr:isoprenylcysteine carboxylmethyltransferase family protein [Ignavibacteriaceae bacterium]
MELVIDVLIIILLFAVFGYIHSLLASEKIKIQFKKIFGELIAFYRILYNIFSLISLYFIYEFSPKPHIIIYDLQNPFDLIILIPQFLSLAGVIWVFKYICFREFLGLDQIKRFIGKRYTTELDEEFTLRIEGPYRYSRHPIYFFSITFLLFRPTMDLFYLTFFICIVAYFYIGSYYEEKKLVRQFGEVYVKYQKEVPGIIPFKLFKPFDQKIYSESN